MRKLELDKEILSYITIYNKYARHLPLEDRRETFEEIVTRNMNMHIDKFPELKESIESIYEKFVFTKKVLPSMRSLQFGGAAIQANNSRIYNCFSRETEFITAKGVKSFKDFNNGDEIEVLTPFGNWKKAIVKSYGNQSLNTITFSKGKSIKIVKATENHRWLTVKGETTNLKKGDVILKAKDIFSEFNYEDASPMERLYWCYGFVYGDGTVVKDSKGIKKYSMLRLCGSDTQFEQRFIDLGFKSSSSNSLSGDIMVYTGKYLKESPNLDLDSPELIRAFVSGYLQADGEKNNCSTHINTYKSIQSSDKEHIEFIRKAFGVAGIHITNERDLTGEQTNYGKRPLTSKFGIYHAIGHQHSTHWVVKSIEENTSTEKVWCLEVEDDKAFVLKGGISTGNCAYMPVDDVRSFSECMFLLLGGSGVGYSVQNKHISKLPVIKKPLSKTRKYVIEDSIMGWADAVKVLFKSYIGQLSSTPLFDFSQIREKGALLVTAGGKAPGPEPLKICLIKIEAILKTVADGEKLNDIQSHDIMCHIADAVLAGGIRRAAMISLFDMDSELMLSCKSGAWWENNPQRGRANNSAVILRHKITKKEFTAFWEKIKNSGSGEPGFYLTYDSDWGTNPCCRFGNLV